MAVSKDTAFLSGKILLFSPGYIIIIFGHKNIYATVAQLVEQLIRNQQVTGSSPVSSCEA